MCIIKSWLSRCSQSKYYVEFARLRIKRNLSHTIKDTWTKPRGRVEVGEGGGFSWGGVEGWGEKAYNCN